jgi:hypothetical protein
MSNAFIDPLGFILWEFHDLAIWDLAEADYARQHDLPLDEINSHAGSFGICNVTFDGCGQFDIDANGIAAVVTHVFGEDDETIIDLCAWSVDRPETFGTALGRAALLGAARVVNSASWALGQALQVHRQPFDWFKSGCQGVVILDHRWAGPVLAGALGPLLAEDAAHARDLKMMLCVPPIDPRNILYPRHSQWRAA